MIELQVINKILADRSLNFYLQKGISGDYFRAYREEFDFIQSHYREYGMVPDKETFADRFQEFTFLEVTEKNDFLINKLLENYLYGEMVPFVHTLAEKLKDNSFEAMEYLQVEFKRLQRIGLFREGHDLVKDAHMRLREYEKRKNVKGLLGITTGLDELDNFTNGWLPEDLVTIVGRTNEGKTWLLLFFLVAAWRSGKRILLYSGEMGKTEIGFRIDTIMFNFSNLGLMAGDENLGVENPYLDIPKRDGADYVEYINALSKEETAFVVITPSDLGGRKLDVAILHGLIEKYEPGIVGIDQISLMEDIRKGENKRIRYANISEDLYLTSESYKIPILLPVQANREITKERKKDITPGIEHIGEADAIGQNSTRIISLRQIDGTLKIELKKNRYGLNNQELICIWDIDRGVLRPALSVSAEVEGEEAEKRSGEGEF